jgi:hypothetical protein
MAKQREKTEDYNEAYNQAWTSFGPWQTEARRDVQAKVGDIYTAKEKQRLRLRGSDVLSIQLIRRLIKWVAGYQADNRKAIRYSPIDNFDDQTATDLTDVLSWVMQHSSGYEIVSKAFEQALTTGLCLVNTFNDSNRDTRLDHYFYNQFLLDPSFTRLDLHDCRYGILRKFITKDQAKILLPEQFHGRINNLEDETNDRGGKFPNYVSPIVHGEKLIAYDEFQEKTTKSEIVIINRVTGQETLFDGTKKQADEQIPVILQANGIDPNIITTITRIKETVEVSAFMNGEHFVTALDPFGMDDFSFTPVWCYFDPEHDRLDWKLQGFVRGLKEIQRAESKRIVAMIAWYENSISQGLDFEEGSLKDPEDAWATGAQPRMFTAGALQNGQARDRQMPAFPSGNIELHQILEDSMAKTIGLTPEMMGALPEGTNAEISGLVTQLRIGAGMVGQRTLFDDLSTSQNLIGDKLLKLIQKYPIEKIKRILGRDPSQAFFDRNFGRFDAVSAEAAMSDTQKNTRYQELLSLKRLSRDLGEAQVITMADLLEHAPTEINTELLLKIQQREEEATQAQQAAAEQQSQIQEVTMDLLQSQATQAKAKASESPSIAIKNMTQAELNSAKADSEKADIGKGALDSAIEIRKLQLEEQKLTQPLQKGK